MFSFFYKCKDDDHIFHVKNYTLCNNYKCSSKCTYEHINPVTNLINQLKDKSNEKKLRIEYTILSLLYICFYTKKLYNFGLKYYDNVSYFNVSKIVFDKFYDKIKDILADYHNDILVICMENDFFNDAVFIDTLHLYLERLQYTFD